MNTIRRWIFVSLCLVGTSGDAGEELIWRDGALLRGRITGATADELTFVSPMFAQPVTLSQAVLGEVRFQPSGKAAMEPFLVSLPDGKTVTGDLMEISNDRMIVRNSTLGDFSIPLDEVLSVRRVTSEEKFPLPDGWSPKYPAGNKPVSALKLGAAPPPADALEGVHRRINLPERCDIVFKLRTNPKPQCCVVVTGANGRKVTVEAKNGDLVLQGRLFFLIKNLEAVDGVVKLHLYWNQRTGRSVLCKSGGVCIGDTTKGPVGDVSGGDTQGIRIERAFPADAIEYLGVSSWDDGLPVTSETDGPSVLLTDETAVQGRVVGVAGGQVLIKGPDGKMKSVPLGKVFRIRFAQTLSTPRKPEPVALWFADGTQLDGVLTGIRDGVGTLQTRLMPRPMSFKLDALRQMVFQPGADDAPSPATVLETLTSGDEVLHGAVENGTGGVHWRMSGAKTGVPITPGLAYSITRTVESAAADSAVFHLASGEVWSGRLTGMNRKEVEAAWDFSAPFKLPAEQVRAIQFAADRVNIKGFKESEWVPTTGPSSAVVFSEQSVTLSGNATLTHPDAMRAGEISFQWQPVGSYCALPMRLFCTEAGGSSSGILVTLNCSQGKVRVWVNDGKGVVSNREVGAILADLTKPVSVRMRVEDDHVAVWVNDSSRYVFLADSKQRPGNALRFEVKQTSRLMMVINGRAVVRPLDAPIRIWDFTASTDAKHHRPAGGVPLAARDEALRIPRFRQDAPPRHVVVAANRDLLRGEIESVADGSMQFRAGLETLRIPLDRLAAIIAPLPALAADVTNETNEIGGGTKEPLTFVALNSGGRVGVKFEAIRDGVLFGGHPLIGECRIPLAKIASIDTRASDGLIAARSLDAWRWEAAPVLPEPGGESSLLLGKEAATFKLPLVGGGDFDLAQEKGRVVVLDFWATWCGPCVKSLPGLIEVMSVFSSDKVKFIGVNQGEGGEVVRRFLETRGLKLTVAMDARQSVAQQYGAEGIPHTVIIGPDGKVAWVKSGYSPEGAKEAAAAVTKLLVKP